MTSPWSEPEFVLSVFDRLCDNFPSEVSEDRPLRVGPRDVVKASVLKNIDWLLNSRRYIGAIPGNPHLDRSVLTYGLPDFSQLTMDTSDDREELRSAIESAIRRFEPRLTHVIVSPPEFAERGDLRFQIDAFLRLRPAPEFVSFDSVLLLSLRTFELRG